MATRTAALLFGLNYPGTASALQGCIRDVENVAAFLRTRLGFAADAIAMCTDGRDASAESVAGTTRAGILAQLRALAARSAQLDFVWIHFSGHGAWRRDTSGDEVDRRDECWVPSDYSTAGFLEDDAIGAVLATFAPTTRIFLVSDSCFSGTVADLPRAWRIDARASGVAVPALTSSAAATSPWRRAAAAPRVVSLSGCLDSQTSADAFGLLPGVFSGALTTLLLQTLTGFPAALRNMFTAASRVAAALRAQRFTQIPLLCASFDLAAAPDFLPPAAAAAQPLRREVPGGGGGAAARVLARPGCPGLALLRSAAAAAASRRARRSARARPLHSG
jgi:hypothetical protein